MDERTQNERLSPWVIVGRVVFTLALAGCIWFIFSNSMAVAQVSTHAARGFIPMMELIDRDKELARLNKEKAKAEKEMAMFANQLNNPKFVERAPAALVEDIRNKYAKSQDKLANIEQSIKALG